MVIKEKIKKIKLSRLIFYSKNIIVKDGKLFDVCYNIFIPKNSIINGGLFRINNLSELPDNLTVNGGLYCPFNNLTDLPVNLTVNGNLFCKNQKSGIKLELPKSAIVKGTFIN